jgi:hypothetical protein
LIIEGGAFRSQPVPFGIEIVHGREREALPRWRKVKFAISGTSSNVIV